MSRWVRTAVLALIITAIAIASIAHATTWVFWVPVQDNSPSNGTSATWGNYWGGTSLFYTNTLSLNGVAVKWFFPSNPMHPGTSVTTDVVHQFFRTPEGPSGDATWFALSSASTLSGYAYQGVIASYSYVPIGSDYTFSAGYQYFVAVGIIALSSETCGQMYFHADVYNNSTSTALFNAVYIIENATWSYVTFFSEAVPPNSWFNPAVPGPSTCFVSGNQYSNQYTFIAIISINTTEYTVGTAQVSIGTTSEGTSAIPGTQYAWQTSNSYYPNGQISSGDSLVIPWNTYANPYIEYFVQTVVNTAGSNVNGKFVIIPPSNVMFYGYGAYPGVFIMTNPVSSSAPYIVYTYDNDTGSFMGNSAVIYGWQCPSGTYMLPATVSPAVTKILSCQSLSSPSTGIAVYPTDYGRYSSAWTYNAQPGYLLTISYTDSAGKSYGMSDYVGVSAPIYIYISRSYSSVMATQESLGNLATNLSLFSFQPMNMGVLNQFYTSFPAVGFIITLPNGYISSNPYGGQSGWTNLVDAVAVDYGAVTMVVWFYEPSGGMGGLFNAENNYFPAPPGNVGDLITAYISGNTLYISDTENGLWLSTSISPGWHMLVVEEWASSTSGPYYLSVYLDGNLIGTESSSSMGGVFNPFSNSFYIGGSYQHVNGWGQGWWMFNGTIAYFAIYNTVLNQSQVQQLYSDGFPNSLFSNNLVVAYVLSNTTYYVFDGVSHFYIEPYFANQQILSQLGISNASLVTITPLGQVGWVPFTQWQQVTNYSVVSYCKLMSYYTFNYLGGSKYQVVLVTNTNMNQFPLDYQFLITSGSGNQYVLPVYAYGNTNTFTNTTTATPTASAFLPVCDAPPSTVPVAIETTAVTPVCNTNNIGYTTTNLEKLPNGTTYTYTLTYILGTNASNLPPALVPTTILAYPYVLMLAVLLIIVIVMYRFGDLGMRNSLILAGATAVVTVLAYLGVGNPYVSFNLSCPNANAPVTVTVPLPQNLLLATTWLGIIAIILIITSLTTEYTLW